MLCSWLFYPQSTGHALLHAAQWVKPTSVPRVYDYEPVSLREVVTAATPMCCAGAVTPVFLSLSHAGHNQDTAALHAQLISYLHDSCRPLGRSATQLLLLPDAGAAITRGAIAAPQSVRWMFFTKDSIIDNNCAIGPSHVDVANDMEELALQPVDNSCGSSAGRAAAYPDVGVMRSGVYVAFLSQIALLAPLELDNTQVGPILCTRASVIDGTMAERPGGRVDNIHKEFQRSLSQFAPDHIHIRERIDAAITGHHSSAPSVAASVPQTRDEVAEAVEAKKASPPRIGITKRAYRQHHVAAPPVIVAGTTAQKELLLSGLSTCTPPWYAAILPDDTGGSNILRLSDCKSGADTVDSWQARGRATRAFVPPPSLGITIIGSLASTVSDHPALMEMLLDAPLLGTPPVPSEQQSLLKMLAPMQLFVQLNPTINLHSKSSVHARARYLSSMKWTGLLPLNLVPPRAARRLLSVYVSHISDDDVSEIPVPEVQPGPVFQLNGSMRTHLAGAWLPESSICTARAFLARELLQSCFDATGAGTYAQRVQSLDQQLLVPHVTCLDALCIGVMPAQGFAAHRTCCSSSGTRVRSFVGLLLCSVIEGSTCEASDNCHEPSLTMPDNEISLQHGAPIVRDMDDGSASIGHVQVDSITSAIDGGSRIAPSKRPRQEDLVWSCDSNDNDDTFAALNETPKRLPLHGTVVISTTNSPQLVRAASSGSALVKRQRLAMSTDLVVDHGTAETLNHSMDTSVLLSREPTLQALTWEIGKDTQTRSRGWQYSATTMFSSDIAVLRSAGVLSLSGISHEIEGLSRDATKQLDLHESIQMLGHNAVNVLKDAVASMLTRTAAAPKGSQDAEMLKLWLKSCIIAHTIAWLEVKTDDDARREYLTRLLKNSAYCAHLGSRMIDLQLLLTELEHIGSGATASASIYVYDKGVNSSPANADTDIRSAAGTCGNMSISTQHQCAEQVSLPETSVDCVKDATHSHLQIVQYNGGVTTLRTSAAPPLLPTGSHLATRRGHSHSSVAVDIATACDNCTSVHHPSIDICQHPRAAGELRRIDTFTLANQSQLLPPTSGRANNAYQSAPVQASTRVADDPGILAETSGQLQSVEQQQRSIQDAPASYTSMEYRVLTPQHHAKFVTNEASIYRYGRSRSPMSQSQSLLQQPPPQGQLCFNHPPRALQQRILEADDCIRIVVGDRLLNDTALLRALDAPSVPRPRFKLVERADIPYPVGLILDERTAVCFAVQDNKYPCQVSSSVAVSVASSRCTWTDATKDIIIRSDADGRAFVKSILALASRFTVVHAILRLSETESNSIAPTPPSLLTVPSIKQVPALRPMRSEHRRPIAAEEPTPQNDLPMTVLREATQRMVIPTLNFPFPVHWRIVTSAAQGAAIVRSVTSSCMTAWNVAAGNVASIDTHNLITEYTDRCVSAMRLLPTHRCDSLHLLPLVRLVCVKLAFRSRSWLIEYGEDSDRKQNDADVERIPRMLGLSCIDWLAMEGMLSKLVHLHAVSAARILAAYAAPAANHYYAMAASNQADGVRNAYSGSANPLHSFLVSSLDDKLVRLSAFLPETSIRGVHAQLTTDHQTVVLPGMH